MAKIEIKSICGRVLFEYDKVNNTIKDTLEKAVKSGANLRYADLCGAYLSGINLSCADLRGANLRCAYLHSANLSGANLSGADLHGANLGGADLCGVYFTCANLCGADLLGANLRCADLHSVDFGDARLDGTNLLGANLCRANLDGANLCRANLCGADFTCANLLGANLGDWGNLSSVEDILIVGSIGSRNGYTTIYHTNKGVFVQCGCFNGTLDEFSAKVKKTHSGTKYESDYLALIEFAKIKFNLSTNSI